LFENVDRLLKSPSSQRGRDFAVILQSLNELGYVVEWRVVNATEIHATEKRKQPERWIIKEGVFANAFALTAMDGTVRQFKLTGNLVSISEHFNKSGSKSLFHNTGLMVDGKITTIKAKAKYNGSFTLLKDIILNSDVPERFYIKENELVRWQYLKGSKKIPRRNIHGVDYYYTEGSMPFPDSLEKPSRTIITSEGGAAPSRCKHVICTPKGLRRLIPMELERLNMFPEGHTELDGITDVKRAFLMGNALVVGLIEKIGMSLNILLADEFATSNASFLEDDCV
jgi:DNA (cytosine-5)-methyltransferase 1